MKKLQINLEGFKVMMDVQVRFRDTDAMGHVNNAVYLSYLEVGRVEYWKKLFGITRPDEFTFILASAEIEFLSPIQIKDSLKIGVRICQVRGASYDFEYAIWADSPKRLVCVAKTVQVMYDYKEGKPTRIPDAVRAKVSKFEGLNA